MTNCIKQCTRCAKVFENAQDIVTKGNRIHVCDSGHFWFNCSCGSTLFLPKGKFEWFVSQLDIPDLQTNSATGLRQVYFDFDGSSLL